MCIDPNVPGNTGNIQSENVHWRSILQAKKRMGLPTVLTQERDFYSNCMAFRKAIRATAGL